MRRKIHREDILQKGRDLMFLNGYGATGIKDITDALEMPKGSFYNHFSSKEEFGMEVLKIYADSGEELYKNSMLQVGEGSIVQLRAFFEKLVQDYKVFMEFKYGCLMGNFSTELADVNEEFRLKIEEGFLKHESVLVECLERARSDGRLEKDENCELLGSFILNSWHGALLRMKATADSKPLQDFIDVVFGRLLA